MRQEPVYTDPSAEQTPAEIEAYLRGLKVGDEVAIVDPQGGYQMLSIRITTVTEVRPRGRIWTEKSAAYGDNRWFVKSGKNCGAPTGQSRLRIPTESVRKYAEEKRFFLD